MHWQAQTRNLEIPGSVLRTAPGMTIHSSRAGKSPRPPPYLA